MTAKTGANVSSRRAPGDAPHPSYNQSGPRYLSLAPEPPYRTSHLINEVQILQVFKFHHVQPRTAKRGDIVAAATVARVSRSQLKISLGKKSQLTNTKPPQISKLWSMHNNKAKVLNTIPHHSEVRVFVGLKSTTPTFLFSGAAALF